LMGRLVASDPPEVLGSSVHRMTLHPADGGAERLCVAVKVVPLDIRGPERAALLTQVSRNYTCGKGVGAPPHPNVVGFHGAYFDPRERTLGIVMDYIDGGSLQQLYLAWGATGDVVPHAALRGVALQALQALEHLHAARCIHRDLKPASILVDVKGQVLLTDLGNLGHLPKTYAQAASVVGTTCYFAPERILGVAFSTSVDIWGLGLSLLEAALGRFPFADHQHNYMALLEYVVECECPVDATSQGVLSESLGVLLTACLSKQPRSRPSARDLLHPPQGFLAEASRDEAAAALADAASRFERRGPV